jgi:nucleoside-diphosphate-sugar epimerase
MRIFLTGATGYIGAGVLDAFIKHGDEVTALVRDANRGRAVKAHGAAPLVGDLADTGGWVEAAQGHDAWVHTAFEYSPRGPDVDRLAIEGILAAAGARGERPAVFVYTSGIWVLGPTSAPASEDAPLNPLPLVAWRPAHETLVLAADGNGLRTAVIRPGIVYGGSRGIVADLFKDGENGLIRIVGDGNNRWPLVYERDLAELYVKVTVTAGASGVFHANDEGDERVGDIVETIARNVKTRADVRHIPIEEARTKMGPIADALALDQVVRSPRARALGWVPSLRSVGGNVPRLLEEWRSGRDRS